MMAEIGRRSKGRRLKHPIASYLHLRRQGMTFAAIAEALGVSVGLVGAKLKGVRRR
jgi:hypothetical protein